MGTVRRTAGTVPEAPRWAAARPAEGQCHANRGPAAPGPAAPVAAGRCRPGLRPTGTTRTARVAPRSVRALRTAGPCRAAQGRAAQGRAAQDRQAAGCPAVGAAALRVAVLGTAGRCPAGPHRTGRPPANTARASWPAWAGRLGGTRQRPGASRRRPTRIRRRREAASCTAPSGPADRWATRAAGLAAQGRAGRQEPAAVRPGWAGPAVQTARTAERPAAGPGESPASMTQKEPGWPGRPAAR